MSWYGCQRSIYHPPNASFVGNVNTTQVRKACLVPHSGNALQVQLYNTWFEVRASLASVWISKLSRCTPTSCALPHSNRVHL